MLIIRREQMEVLGQVVVRIFEDRMVKHLEEFFSRQCEILGEVKVREIIGNGIARAESHGFTNQQDTCLFISLMFRLGSNFDADPQLPWAGAILNDNAMGEPDVANTLYNTAREYLDRVAGVNNENLERAVAVLGRKPIYDYWESWMGDFEADVMILLGQIWREKRLSMDRAALHRTIQIGLESAKRYKITSQRGAATYIGLMFMLGSSFDTDPQFPWASSILNNPSLGDEALRLKRLHEEAVAYLERLLSEGEREGS